MNEIWFILFKAGYIYQGRTTDEAKAVRFFQQGGRFIIAYSDYQSWVLEDEEDWRQFHGLTR
jgi:hypothetical protein